MRIRRIIVPSLILLAIITCSSAIAKADSVTFTIGNNPQSDEENVLLNSGASGTTVFGLTNQTQLQVSFSSTTDTLVELPADKREWKHWMDLLTTRVWTAGNGDRD